MGEGSLTGRLLVATPLIADPNFERTVILLLAHSGEGALGVVLNRPSDVRAEELVPGWGAVAAEPAVMFLGGPVEPGSVIGLSAGRAVDLNEPPPEVGEPVHAVRLFAGSAGWGPGQLEDELGEEAWWVLDADGDEALTADPSGLWPRVLRRQRGTTAWFAVYPPDPAVN